LRQARKQHNLIQDQRGAAFVLELVLVAIVLAVVGFAGWQFYQSKHSAATTNKAKPLTKLTVRLLWLNQAQFTGMYTAQEKGYYREAGLDVDLKEYEENVDPLKELVDGKIDIGMSTSIEALGGVASGKAVKAIAAIYQTSPWAVVSLKSKNITKPADLKGKVLGAKGGSNEAKLKYSALLDKGNLKPTDATIKSLGYDNDEASDIVSGRADTVDLYRTDQLYSLKQQGIEYNIMLPEAYGIGGYGDVLVASNKMIADKPEVIQAFVTATLKGWEYALDHQAEALGYVAKYENKDYKDAKREQHILAQSAPLIKPASGKAIGSMDFTTWNEMANRMKASGLLDSHFDTSTAYTTKFLR